MHLLGRHGDDEGAVADAVLHQQAAAFDRMGAAAMLRDRLAEDMGGAAEGGFDVAVRVGVLPAEVNASANVDSADMTLVQRQNNKPVTSSNFRMDVNASGNIDSADVALTQRQNQKRLP